MAGNSESTGNKPSELNLMLEMGIGPRQAEFIVNPPKSLEVRIDQQGLFTLYADWDDHTEEIHQFTDLTQLLALWEYRFTGDPTLFAGIEIQFHPDVIRFWDYDESHTCAGFNYLETKDPKKSTLKTWWEKLNSLFPGLIFLEGDPEQFTALMEGNTTTITARETDDPKRFTVCVNNTADFTFYGPAFGDHHSHLIVMSTNHPENHKIESPTEFREKYRKMAKTAAQNSHTVPEIALRMEMGSAVAFAASAISTLQRLEQFAAIPFEEQARTKEYVQNIDPDAPYALSPFQKLLLELSNLGIRFDSYETREEVSHTTPSAVAIGINDKNKFEIKALYPNGEERVLSTLKGEEIWDKIAKLQGLNILVEDHRIAAMIPFHADPKLAAGGIKNRVLGFEQNELRAWLNAIHTIAPHLLSSKYAYQNKGLAQLLAENETFIEGSYSKGSFSLRVLVPGKRVDFKITFDHIPLSQTQLKTLVESTQLVRNNHKENRKNNLTSELSLHFAEHNENNRIAAQVQKEERESGEAFTQKEVLKRFNEIKHPTPSSNTYTKRSDIWEWEDPDLDY